ncbi:MAG: hypothetical protein MRY83_03865 [Flavobacteriales bacterium]|nr:hypothetical protein [Flavobacteriales bacterium]
MRYFLIVVIFLLACDKERNTSIYIGPNWLCQNELDLLNSFDTLAYSPLDIFEVQFEDADFISENFDSSHCCDLVKFNIDHKFDSSYSGLLTYTVHWQCEYCGAVCGHRHLIITLVNANNQILCENYLIKLENLDSMIFTSLKKEYEMDPERFEKMRLSLMTDRETSESFIEKVQNQMIRGYLKFANERAIERYRLNICMLDSAKLVKIAHAIPFNLVIPIFDLNYMKALPPPEESLEIVIE